MTLKLMIKSLRIAMMNISTDSDSHISPVVGIQASSKFITLLIESNRESNQIFRGEDTKQALKDLHRLDHDSI